MFISKFISKKALSHTLFSLISLSFFSTPVFIFADVTPANSQANSQASKPVAITPDQNILTINLKANPTTGYSWYLDQYNQQFFKLNSYQFTPGNKKLMGAPGQASFSFTIDPSFHIAPYLTSIQFTYMRPWDMSTAMHQTLWVLSIPGAPAQVTSSVQRPQASATPAASAPTANNSNVSSNVDTNSISQMPASTPANNPAAPSTAASNSSNTNTTWLSIPAGA